MDIRATLIILVGIVVAAQWLHLWFRQRGNARLQSGPKEPQVVALGASFASAALLWAFGLSNALSSSEDARPAPLAAVAAAFVFATIGVGLRVAAIERIGRGFSWGTEPPSALITDGIYRYMKHPLIVGYLFEVWALGYCTPDTGWGAALLLVIVATSAYCGGLQMTKEERILSERFPEEWPRYSDGKTI